jgi:nitronate monooxygenase
LGTRFLANTESRAHPHYKNKLLAANEGIRSRLSCSVTAGRTPRTERPAPNATTAFVQQWLGQEARGQESRPDEPVIGQTVIGGQAVPVLRFMGFPPNCDARGDIDSMDLVAGQGVDLVREIKPAGQIVRELVEEAQQIIAQHSAPSIATEAGITNSSARRYQWGKLMALTRKPTPTKPTEGRTIAVSDDV